MTPLKKARLLIRLTVADVAQKVGVSESTYQKWEAPGASIPAGKLKKLADILLASPDEFNVKPNDNFHFSLGKRTPTYINYFGELAIHFKSGKTLLFSVTAHQRDCFAEAYYQGNAFIPVIGMNNRSYLLSTQSILDVYLSDDAADACGPELYEPDGVNGLEEDEWCVVDQLEHADLWDVPCGFSLIRLAKMMKAFGHDPSSFEDDFPDGFDFDQVPAVVPLTTADRDKVYHYASAVRWQLANGVQRSEPFTDDALVNGFAEFFEMEGDCEEAAVYLDFDENAFSVMMRAESVDYLSCPTHALDRAMLRAAEAEIDG